MMDFIAHQAQFAAYIRNPQQNPLPLGVKPERMAMYRELFFNNINGLLSSNFPVIHQILSQQAWLALVNDFFEHHHCHTPHFSEVAEEFLAFLQNERQENQDLPFLVELAHYEWVEMALSIANANDDNIGQTTAQSSEKALLELSSLVCLLAYQFPVHRISPAFLPADIPSHPTFLLVYRNHEDQVLFLELTPLTYQLLQLIEQSPRKPLDDYLQQLIACLQEINAERILSQGTKMIQEFVTCGIVRSF
jgi:hypothetical protein